MRVAAVDIGTNSTRLLVADVDGGSLTEIVRRTTITRLGEGVDAKRILQPIPIGRVHAALAEFKREADELGAERRLVVATSATRDAANGREFLDGIEREFGFTTRLLSGDEEASLTLRGVRTGGDLPDGTVILDVGGGSTELTGDRLHVSLDIGSVRLTERFLHSDPPAESELDAGAEFVRSLLPAASVEALVGVAGTITTIAAIEFGRYDPAEVHGCRIPLDRIDAQLQRLAALPLARRRAVPGLDPERAPVIVGGVLIVREALRHFGLADLEVSERDLLTGTALLAAD